jgi:hypothetical protein
VARIKNIYNVYLENLKETDHPEDLVLDERITMDFDRKECENVYSRIEYTKSPSFCTITLTVSLTNLTTLPTRSYDHSRYVNRRILAPPLL